MRSRLLKYKRKERKKCADGNGPIDQNDDRRRITHPKPKRDKYHYRSFPMN